MTDDKLTAARRALSQIADQVTDTILHNQGNHRLIMAALVHIREIAQDAAEATLDKVETRT